MLLSRSIAAALGAFLFTCTVAPQVSVASQIKTLNAPGCKWIGTRVVQSLVRDDIIAANEYNDMYKTMACPAKDLILAFSCTVKEINNPEGQDEKQSPSIAATNGDTSPPLDEMPRIDKAKATQHVIDACWDDPRGK